MQISDFVFPKLPKDHYESALSVLMVLGPRLLMMRCLPSLMMTQPMELQKSPPKERRLFPGWCKDVWMISETYFAASQLSRGLRGCHLHDYTIIHEYVDFFCLSQWPWNQVNNNGWSALIWCAINGCEEVATALLSASANYLTADNEGRTGRGLFLGPVSGVVAAVWRKPDGRKWVNICKTHIKSYIPDILCGISALMLLFLSLTYWDAHPRHGLLVGGQLQDCWLSCWGRMMSTLDSLGTGF